MKHLSRVLGLGAAIGGFAIAACVGDPPAPLPDDDTDSASPTPGNDSGTPGNDSATPGNDSGVDAADAGPKRFCDTQGPLAGVTNFFCADFDGTSLTEGWTTAWTDGGGAITADTDVFHSAPNSITTGKEATLEWDSNDAKNATEVDVTFQMNVGTLGGTVAAEDGYITLLKIDQPAGETTLTLNYASGRDVGTTTGFTGYYVNIVSCPNACSLAEYPITAAPIAPNTWTQVALTWTSGGGVRISYNGVPVFNQAMAFVSVSKIVTTLGLVDSPPAPALPRTAFDDVMISIHR